MTYSARRVSVTSGRKRFLASGNWLVAQRFVTTILYKLLRLVFITVQRIYWQLNGTARQLRQARLPHNYQQSAHVLDVVLCHKFCPLLTTTLDDFLCTHNRFEDPQYIIDNDNITLLTINEHDAVFCEAEEKGMHLWRGEYNAHINYAQMDFCRSLIVVPMSTFHRLADTIGDPAGQLVFLFNTGRCGSTLLTQILECTGRCVSISEPTSPNLVGARYRKYGDSAELRQMARDIIRWECRPYPTLQTQPLCYFLKLAAPSICAFPILRELFPASRCLYMYRDIVTVGKSVYRTMMVLPSVRLAYVLGRLSTRMMSSIIDSMGFDGSMLNLRTDTPLTSCVVLSAVTTTCYLDLRRRGFDISALRYEDLVARPLDMCRVVLEFCRLPVSLADLAVKAFDVDSQRNCMLARSIIGRFSEPQLTPHTKARLNALLDKFDLPRIGEPDILEGTLTVPDDDKQCSTASAGPP